MSSSARNNRYSRKMKHKRYTKERYAKKWYYGGYGTWNRMLFEYTDLDPLRKNYPLTYWREYYLTGNRKYARAATNARVRSRYKQNLRRYGVGDDAVSAMRRGQYRRSFDYDNTVW